MVTTLGEPENSRAQQQQPSFADTAEFDRMYAPVNSPFRALSCAIRGNSVEAFYVFEGQQCLRMGMSIAALAVRCILGVPTRT
jgi:hypothetical protein